MRTLAFIALILTACASTREAAAPATSARGEWLQVSGGRIYYEVAGRGPAVVLSHGGFGDRRMWDPQFAVLARNFRVVRYDHRGFGNSSFPDSAYSPVRDLVQLLDHLGIDKTHLVGNSMGGAFALDFALLQPARVARLVVVGSGANGYPYTDDEVESVRAVFRTAAQQGVDKGAELWLQHPMVAVSSQQSSTRALVRQMVWDNKRIFELQHWPSEVIKPATYDRLTEVRAPVLFIIGDKDTPVVKRTAEMTAARLPGSQIWHMPGGDHLPHLIDPDAFNARVIEFLQRD